MLTSELNCKYRKLNFSLLSILTALSIILFLLLKYEKDGKVEQFLADKTKIYTQNYDAVYNNKKRISQIIFDTEINTKETIDILKNFDEKKIDDVRLALYNSLKDTYGLLLKYNLKQLHFHDTTNHSILRFHRPHKFGDDLTKIRETVNFVNTKHKPIDGFEEGRIYNGYRFVYPLKDDQKHLGSVEISFSTLAMTKDIIKNHKVMANFLILKKKVDQKVFLDEKINYKDSIFSRFYIEAEAYNYAKFTKENNNGTKKVHKNDYQVNQFFDSNKESISLYCGLHNKVLTLLKVKNPVTLDPVGIFIIHSDPYYIHNKTKNFYFALGLGILFLLVVLLFIKKEILYRDKIKQDNKEIERLNGNLQNEINQAIESLKTKEKLLSEKSKMASMGEMIDSIAHQWMQPISVIKLRLQTLQMDIDYKELTDEKVITTIDSCDKQIVHLTETIHEFRGFFRPNTQKKALSVKELIESSLMLVQGELLKNTIQTKIIGDYESFIEVTGNEFKHVIINLVNNAKDAFVENKIKDRIITFDIKIDHQITLYIADNAGGVPEKIINNIFDSNFTTKGEEQGTGIGLYMSKQIIEKMGATISVQNNNSGATFKIEVPISFLK